MLNFTPPKLDAKHGKYDTGILNAKNSVDSHSGNHRPAFCFFDFTATIMMHFCELCNNLLYPRENKQRKALEYYCKQNDCQYVKQNPDSTRVFVNEIIKDSS